MSTILRRIPQEPAPWKLEAREIWTLPLPRTSLLPHGAFDPNDGPELVQDWENSGASPVVQIIRYADSPVGPYDTLLFSWLFSPPPSLLPSPTRTKLPRLTRTYASTLSAVQNARRNWHIPQHLAQFKFTPLRTSCFRAEATLIEVCLPGQAKPFFATVASAYGRTLNLPPLPPLPFLQPPLRRGKYAERSQEGWFLAERTEVWTRSMAVKFFPALDVEAGEGGKRYGDGVGFPDFELGEGEKAIKGVVGRDGEVVIGEARRVGVKAKL